MARDRLVSVVREHLISNSPRVFNGEGQALALQKRILQILQILQILLRHEK